MIVYLNQMRLWTWDLIEFNNSIYILGEMRYNNQKLAAARASRRDLELGSK
jgi:hypothetical protein